MTKVSRFLHHVSLPEWQQSVYIRSADIRTYLILTTITSVILALPQPNTLLKPQCVVEDGMIFFAQAYNLPPIEALTQVYAGYWHAIPRLIAEPPLVESEPTVRTLEVAFADGPTAIVPRAHIAMIAS